MYARLKKYVIDEYLDELPGFHDRSRVVLIFNIAFSTMFLGVSAAIVSIVVKAYPVLVPSVGNFLCAVLAMFLLKKKRLFIAATLYLGLLFFLLFGNLIFNYGTMHIGSPFWVALLNILVIYILGIRWGVFSLIFSLLGFLYYLHFVMPQTLELMLFLPKGVYYSAYYETFFALFLLGYIIGTILKASRQSDQMLKEQNSQLSLQYAQLKAKEEEKTVLLKEIHHRVKNNLQVIVSLMRLQMRDLSNPDTLNSFTDTINRVLTMAKIHEKMYQSEELSKVNLEHYFESLSEELIGSYHVQFPVDFSFSFAIERVGLNSVIPLALIYNELLSNSLKHAFDEGSTPRIDVSMAEVNDKQVLFEYGDNGTWKVTNESNSFGLELIKSLTEQLEGSYTFTTDSGSHYRFVFGSMGD